MIKPIQRFEGKYKRRGSGNTSANNQKDGALNNSALDSIIGGTVMAATRWNPFDPNAIEFCLNQDEELPI